MLLLIYQKKGSKTMKRMNYYLLDTTEGIQYIKTKEKIRNRDHARKIVGCGVCWVAPATASLYYLRKVIELFGLKF